MSRGEQAPDISVIIVTDVAATIQRVVEHLRAQTIHDRVELVIATPNPRALEQAGLADGRLAAVRIVEIDAITPLTAARAAGVRAATAPFVFLGETHTFPHPAMLGRIVEAHRAGRDRVAPVFTNANPTNAVSWAGFLMDYGRHAAPASSGEGPLPVYNCSYRRSLLLTLDPALDHLLQGGSTLNDDLRSRGCRSYRAGDAYLAHLNVATRRGLLRERYLVGRNIGARISRRWPLWRRLTYILGAPLIPVVLGARLFRADGMRERIRAAPRLTPLAIVVGLALRGVGEAVGFGVGAGLSEAELEEMEIHKLRYT